MKIKYIIVIFAFYFSLPALSKTESNYYTGIKLGNVNYENHCNLKSLSCDEESLGFGYYLGYDLASWLSVEAGLNYFGENNSTYSNYEDKNTVSGADFSALFNLPVTYDFSIYTRIGAAYQHIKSSGIVSDTDNVINRLIGFGLDYRLNSSWSLRAETQFIDGMGNQRSDNSDIIFTSIGVSYYFGPKEANVVPFVEEQQAVTESSSVTENQYIPPAITYRPVNVYFDSDSSIVSDKNDIIDFAKQYQTDKSKEKKTIQIVGHTDNTASQAYNQALSVRRANSVAKLIEQQGVNASAIEVSGKGELQPVANNATPEGRQQNRRVEISVTD